MSGTSTPRNSSVCPNRVRRPPGFEAEDVLGSKMPGIQNLPDHRSRLPRRPPHGGREGDRARSTGCIRTLAVALLRPPEHGR